MQYLANISQFEALSNGRQSVGNNAVFDRLQDTARAVVPSLLLGIPLAHAGMLATHLMKQRSQESRPAIHAPVIPDAKNGDNAIYDFNGNIIQRYGNDGFQRQGDGDNGKNLADISKFESLMNSACVFNKDIQPKPEGGYWAGDEWGWHAYNELPTVEPDDGWNIYRVQQPTYFLECGMTTPDDGWNKYRTTPAGRYRVAMIQFRDLIKGRIRDVMGGADEDQILPLVKTLRQDWEGGEWLRESGFDFKFDWDKYDDYAERWWNNWTDRRHEEQRIIDEKATENMDVLDEIEYYLRKDGENWDYKEDLYSPHFYKEKAEQLYNQLDRNQQGEARKGELGSQELVDPYFNFRMWVDHALSGGYSDNPIPAVPYLRTDYTEEECIRLALYWWDRMSDENMEDAARQPNFAKFKALYESSPLYEGDADSNTEDDIPTGVPTDTDTDTDTDTGLDIYDKAQWHIDGGEDPADVVNRFGSIFDELHEKGMLSDEGEELYALGIDSSASLHDRLLTPEGRAYVREKYGNRMGPNDTDDHPTTDLDTDI